MKKSKNKRDEYEKIVGNILLITFAWQNKNTQYFWSFIQFNCNWI